MRTRRWLLQLCVLLCMAPGVVAFAEDRAQQPSTSGEAANGWWEIANFAIFACGIAWFLVKKGPPFFAARSAEIQNGIKDATGLRMEADLRYSEIDKRIASLAEAIKQMRDQGAREMQNVHRKMLQDTQQQSERIRQSSGVEIQALEAEGRRRVRRYMAGLTLSLADKKLREQPCDDARQELLREFVNLVEETKT